MISTVSVVIEKLHYLRQYRLAWGHNVWTSWKDIQPEKFIFPDWEVFLIAAIASHLVRWTDITIESKKDVEKLKEMMLRKYRQGDDSIRRTASRDIVVVTLSSRAWLMLGTRTRHEGRNINLVLRGRVRVHFCRLCFCVLFEWRYEWALLFWGRSPGRAELKNECMMSQYVWVDYYKPYFRSKLKASNGDHWYLLDLRLPIVTSPEEHSYTSHCTVVLILAEIYYKHAKEVAIF